LSYRRRIRDEREKKQYVQAVNTVLKASREDGTHGGGVEGGTDAAARWGVYRFSRPGRSMEVVAVCCGRPSEGEARVREESVAAWVPSSFNVQGRRRPPRATAQPLQCATIRSPFSLYRLDSCLPWSVL
jgi:hypothetical protein